MSPATHSCRNAGLLILSLALLIVLMINPAQASDEPAKSLQLLSDPVKALPNPDLSTPTQQPTPGRDRTGGPDNFGYRWRDNEDGAEYNWIDITQGDMRGNEFGGLSDDWNSGQQDLGWAFNYYGTDYSNIWVSSNGWITFVQPGGAGDYTPDGALPNQNDNAALIAAFFSDLHPSNGGQGHIWWYTNANERIAIFSWINYHHIQQNGPYNFQIIIRGNGSITLNYMDHNACNQGYRLSIGIMNQNRDDGLSVLYEQGGAVPQDEYCVEISKASGVVTGRITDLASEQPLQNVRLTLSGGGGTATSDADGLFTISPVNEGQFTLSASLAGYNDATSEAFNVAEDDTVTVDLALTHPDIALDREGILAQVAQRGAADEVFHITNNGNGPLQWDSYLTVPRRDDFGDVHFQWDLTRITGDQKIRNLAADATYIYATGSNNNANPNYVYVIDHEGNLVRRFAQPQPNPTANGLKGMCFDGTYLYAIETNTIFKFTTDGELLDTIHSPLNPSPYITYDPATDHFWVCNITTALVEIDRAGHEVRRINKPPRAYGITWHPDDPDSCSIYVFNRVANGAQLALDKVNPNTNHWVHVADFAFAEGDVANGCLITNSFNPLLWTFLAQVENGADDKALGVELALNTSWLHVEPGSGTVEAGASQEITAQIEAGAWRPGRYDLMLVINNNTLAGAVNLPISMVVSDEGVQLQHFTFTETVVTESFTITSLLIRGERPAFNDEIAVFQGNLCVGASLWFGANTSITAYQDNPATGEQDGFTDGAVYSFRVWDTSIEREFFADYQLQNGSARFVANGASRVAVVVPGGVRSHDYSLPLGWSLISANLTPDHPAMTDIFGEMVANGTLVIVKDGLGHYYSPRWNFNDIGDWDAADGYWVKVTRPVQFTLTGDLVAASEPIDLRAGWNQIAYYPNQPIDAVTAFGSAGNNLIIVRDGLGQFYLPAHQFSNIGNALPGNGYQLKVREAGAFQYALGRNAAIDLPRLPLVHLEMPEPTSSLMSALLIGEGINRGDEFRVASMNGKVVGGGIAQEGGKVGLAIWGDDGTSSAGLQASESFNIQSWVDGAGWRTASVVPLEGETRFDPDAIAVFQATGSAGVTPSAFGLSDAYPNPFNSSTRVGYSLPKAGTVTIVVTDVAGRNVATLVDGRQAAGSYEVSWNAEGIPSGIYLIKMEVSDFRSVRKVTLMR